RVRLHGSRVLAAGNIPQLDALVGAPCGKHLAIGRESKRCYLPVVDLQPARCDRQLFSSGELAHDQLDAVGSCGWHGWRGLRAWFLAQEGADIPQPDSLIIAPRNERLPVGTENYRVDTLGVSLQSGNTLAAGDVPELDRLVPTRGCQRLAV